MELKEGFYNILHLRIIKRLRYNPIIIISIPYIILQIYNQYFNGKEEIT